MSVGHKKYFSSPELDELQEKGWIHFIQRSFMHTLLDGMRSYTKLETEGMVNIPKTGPVIVVPNHSGVWGWDGMILQNEVLKKIQRIPRTMLHNFWFQNSKMAKMAYQLGFIPQDFKQALRILRRKKLLIIFPEAEAGNFKPSSQMYHIQTFNPGFISLIILTKATIVPCCIIGAEETHINLGTLSWAEKLWNIKIPIPLNILPLPAKWRFIFMPPIHLDKYGRKDAKNEKFLQEAAENIRMQIQLRINKELIKHKKFDFLWDA